MTIGIVGGIVGTIQVNDKAVSTHRDSYLLNRISVVSVRRVFLPGSILTVTGLGAFCAAFSDLLYPSEILTMAGVSALALIAGFQVGQLKLLSRDLGGSPLGDVIWGRYAALNTIRMQIAGKLQQQSKDEGDA